MITLVMLQLPEVKGQDRRPSSFANKAVQYVMQPCTVGCKLSDWCKPGSVRSVLCFCHFLNKVVTMVETRCEL